MEILQRMKELCRYLPSLEGETLSCCRSQVVTCTTLVLFHSAYLYVSAVQPALFQGEDEERPKNTSMSVNNQHFTCAGSFTGEITHMQ